MALMSEGKQGGSVLAWHVQCKCLATHNLNEKLFKTIYLCSLFSFSYSDLPRHRHHHKNYLPYIGI